MTTVQKLEFAMLIMLAAAFMFLTFYILIRSKRKERILKKKIKELESVVNIDYLTNVSSRFSFINRVNDTLVSNPYGMLLIFDIDGFKTINDSYGHIEGDRLLKRFAERLKKVFDGAIVGRLGGDEFLVYISGEIDEGKVVGKIRRADVSSFYDKATNARLAACCGCAKAPDSGLTFEELYAKADEALYKSKKGNKSVSFYEQ